ncbi:cellulose synthase subunit BcsC-related outer membrane protein [Asaia bogorensis]|uniref:Cellulose synthase subunit C n=2 Tax=Asaia bogorensis TaxID=91915 RepID=A7M792_9PROT|nr:cellulose synthase subunit BcsC-related outer membrane protein [Asaia bogorensis]BAF75936.2 cellulose synthase subunit C [Asaia bogorensis]BAK39952.1 cellulose synthase subunit C [Asaia bogorensis NBRC 16594]BAT19705.1 cellulose synthase subunit C [Asaia bogorensis NBRC 16594]GBQ77935.1 cellulose synthase subunit C [Asaia bogorensis NBRC 16594]GEL54461.1 cellulose synthase [Asaia bogorensis NBRC 16594]
MTADRPGLRRSALRAALLASFASSQALADGVPTASPQNTLSADTGKILPAVVKRARYWFEHGRMDDARIALNQARQLAPSDPDVLVLEGQMDLQQGDIAAAHRILKQIREHSNDPDAGRLLDMDLQARSAPGTDIQNARALAQRGATTQAAAAYLKAFPDRPPSLYALEYYRTLAGVPAQREKAQMGLAKLVSGAPNNVEYQIAYAQSLVWDEKNRVTGIQRLEALAKMPGLTEAQRQQINSTTRQSVLWLPATASSDSVISTYLAAHPEDKDIQALRGRALGNTLKPFEIERQKGWDALRANNLQAAIVSFRQALTTAPNDADTLGGLGVTLLRQHRDAEAKTYLDRAMEADPSSATRWRAAESGAVLNDSYAKANYLFSHERYTETLALINPMIKQSPGQSWLRAMRADILERTGRRDDAIAAYEALIAAEPRNASYRERLVRALIEDHRYDEASSVLAQSPIDNPQLKALIYDSQAERASTQTDRLAIFQRADQENALSPWSRLHYAQALLAENRRADAEQVMAPLTETEGTRDPAALQAALFYAAQTGDERTVTRLRAQVPERSMTPDLRRILRQADLRAQVANAPTDPDSARFYFAHLLDQGDPDGSLAQVIATTLYDRGDRAGASQILDLQIARAGGHLNAAQRLAYAGAFLHMRDLERARRLSISLKGAALDATQATQLAQIDTGLAVATSDHLNDQGNRARAYEALAPALDRPNPPVSANLALARLYSSGGQYAQAYQITLQAVQHDPSDLDARLALIQTCISMHRYAEASGYVQQMNAIAPTDPRSWYAAAQLDRARGNIRAAVRELAQARLLRVEQIAPGRESYVRRSNPFASEDVTLQSNQTDPLIRQMDSELTQISDSMAASVTITPGIDSRSGSGLNGLSNVTTDVAGSLPVGGGHIRLAATPTFLSSRSYRSGDVNGPRDIGYNPLNSVIGGALNQSSSMNATGVALSGRYDWRWLTLDAGTSPLGFAVTNVLGGVSVAPKLARNTILTVGAERRSVQDSLISYSGLRDASGATWGGVVRNRVYAQLAYGDENASLYARGGGSYLTGRNTRSNTGYEAGAGGQIRIWGQERPDLRHNLHLGMDLTWFGYDRNEYQFTFGNGGYFSPQNFVAFTFPVTYAGTYKQIDWRVIGRVGYQTYHSSRSQTFPANSDTQALLANVAPLYAYQDGNSANGLTGGIYGAIDYRMTPNLKLSLNADYQKAGPWNEVRAFVAAKYSFLGTK